MTATLEILRLESAHVTALSRLFALISKDEKSAQFHPHPFNAVEARRICEFKGKDLYYGLSSAGEFLGYGILRGWDEGYDIPSLGIYVAPELRGTGAARLLMQHLHLAAKLSGATRVRLKVYRGNAPALRLYESMGYAFDDTDHAAAQIVGYLNLTKEPAIR